MLDHVLKLAHADKRIAAVTLYVKSQAMLPPLHPSPTHKGTCCSLRLFCFIATLRLTLLFVVWPCVVGGALYCSHVQVDNEDAIG